MLKLETNWCGDLERRHLRVAVLFSLLVHASLLPWDFVGTYRQVTLSRPLSVRIIHPPPSQLVVQSEPNPEPEPKPDNPPPDIPAEAVQEVEPKPEPQPIADPAANSVSENQQEEVVQSAEPAIPEDLVVPDGPPATIVRPDDAAPQPASASEVAVLLLIGVNGEVLQIVWDKLPAISYQTLEQMEMRLREKKYPPSESPHTLTVVVTVPK